jgi:hypothetical protein
MSGRRLPGSQRWVSKTDLSRFYRCPFAFWLLDTRPGRLSRNCQRLPDVADPHRPGLPGSGRSATPVTIGPAGLPALLRTEITILGTPLFVNKKLKLRGCPDGIDAASGVLYPIEIKSHRAPTHLDRLELAFYWLLRQPYRTRHAPAAGRADPAP